MNILIYGANSDIAKEIARIYAEKQNRFFLVSRSKEQLIPIKSDLLARGAHSVDFFAADLNDFSLHEEILTQAIHVLGSLDLVLIAHGSLGDQEKCQLDPQKAVEEIRSNLESQVSILIGLANVLEKQTHGHLAVISSVAGDRGKQSNYTHSAAKAGLSIYLEGLRMRLGKSGVTVTTIKPGYVDTKMTAGFEKNLLFASSKSTAKHIVKAIDHKYLIVYTPWFWRWIMLVIKLIPERIWQRLNM